MSSLQVSYCHSPHFDELHSHFISKTIQHVTLKSLFIDKSVVLTNFLGGVLIVSNTHMYVTKGGCTFFVAPGSYSLADARHRHKNVNLTVGQNKNLKMDMSNRAANLVPSIGGKEVQWQEQRGPPGKVWPGCIPAPAESDSGALAR